MDLMLKGKKALVTGATKGIGLRIARQLADEGMDLAICSRTEAAVLETAKSIADQYEVKVVGTALNVRDRDELTDWINNSAKELGGIDLYVSNVTGGPDVPGEEGWQGCLEGDVMGTVRACDTAMPYLKESDCGSIVMIASISGVMAKALPIAGIYGYGSAKAAMIAYAAQLSKDVAKDGVRVNCVSPGPIFFEGGAWDIIKENVPELYQDAMNQCVIGRLGKPEEIAAAVAFLASPVSGFTTSQNLHVDGGYMQHIAF